MSNEVGVSVILAKERYYSCKQHYSLLVTCVMLARYLKSCKNKEEVLVYCNPSPVWPCIFYNLVVEWLLFLRTLDSWNLNELTYELNIYSLKLKLRKSFCKGVWTSHLFFMNLLREYWLWFCTFVHSTVIPHGPLIVISFSIWVLHKLLL